MPWWRKSTGTQKEGQTTKKGKIGFVFSHCHWDIEWYMPFRSYRFWLLELFEQLLEIVKTNSEFKTYVLDGQVAPLEHYLAVKPEKEAEVKKLVQSGRLSIGPFYTQFDEWLVSPESIVRNCLYGDRQAKKFGPKMKAGYLPDNFGHPAQIPQILSGFGLDSLIFMRGMPDKPDGMKDEFFWQGLDGTKILAIHLSATYGNASCLGAPEDVAPPPFRTGPYGDGFVGYEQLLEYSRGKDVEKGAKNLIAAAEKMADGYPSGVIPLANGSDHFPPQTRITGMITKANRMQNEILFIHGNCADLVRLVKKRNKRFSTATFSGELWGSKYQYLLTGTLSTRTYIKQSNFIAENLLEKYAEPLAIFAGIYGKEYPGTLLAEAWRFMFLNQAHDSIHGSSVDPVHREMVQRFDSVRQIATGICHDSLKYLGKSFQAWPGNKDQPKILVYNPVNTGSVPVVADIWIQSAVDNFSLQDSQGKTIPVQIINKNEVIPPKNKKKSYHTSWPEKGNQRIIFAADLPPYRITPFSISPLSAAPARLPFRCSNTAIENEFLRVEFQKGAFGVYDKTAKRWYQGFNTIEDEADAGDAWDFSEPWEENKKYSSNQFPTKCRLVENGPIRAALQMETRMRIPYELKEEKRSGNKVSLPIVWHISLIQGVRRVDVSLTFNNQAKDHRLRLKCPTGLISKTIKSQGHFGILERPLRNPYSGKGWSQPPSPTFHFREWVAVDDNRQGLDSRRGLNGKPGLAIACQGLYEYESRLENGKVVLYITLLRSVGRMGKVNFKSRLGGASPAIPTLEAQCLGEHRFDYAFLPYSCEEESTAPFLPTANAFLFPAIAHQVRGEKAAEIETGKAGSLFSLTPSNLVVSCFKKAEDCPGCILRFWENEGKEVTATISLSEEFAEAYLMTLNEEVIRPLRISDRQIRLKVKPYQIITLNLQ